MFPCLDQGSTDSQIFIFRCFCWYLSSSVRDLKFLLVLVWFGPRFRFLRTFWSGPRFSNLSGSGPVHFYEPNRSVGNKSVSVRGPLVLTSKIKLTLIFRWTCLGPEPWYGPEYPQFWYFSELLFESTFQSSDHSDLVNWLKVIWR